MYNLGVAKKIMKSKF